MLSLPLIEPWIDVVWKLIGFFVGLFSKGPLGALLGLLVGWWLDNSIRHISGNAGNSNSARFSFSPFNRKAQQVFQAALFGCLGHLAKADGKVSEAEIRVAEQLMRQLRLNAQQRKMAISQFRLGKSSNYPLESELAPFAAMTQNMPHLRKLFIEILLNGALSDGAISAAERQILERVARALRLGVAELDRLISMRHRHHAPRSSTPEPDPYQVLGITEQAANQDIKKAYRQLMSQYHPDKMSGRDVPKTMREYADQRVREVRAAYDKLRKQRGFR